MFIGDTVLYLCGRFYVHQRHILYILGIFFTHLLYYKHLWHILYIFNMFQGTSVKYSIQIWRTLFTCSIVRTSIASLVLSVQCTPAHTTPTPLLTSRLPWPRALRHHNPARPVAWLAMLLHYTT